MKWAGDWSARSQARSCWVAWFHRRDSAFRLVESFVSATSRPRVLVHIQQDQIVAHPLADGVHAAHIDGRILFERVHLGPQFPGQAGDDLLSFLLLEPPRGVDAEDGADDLWET